MPRAPHEPAPARPSYSRRHQAGSGSARSLLLTVLGEYVLPRVEPAWTSTLLHVLGGLGVEEKSTRQSLARMAADGWIVAERAGRRVRWALTPHGRELLTEGAERIYSFGRDRDSWDGRWLVLIATVPESRRELRHQLRTRLTWAGFGSPVPGMWVSPHVSREAEAKQVVEQLGLDVAAFSFSGPYAGIGSERTLVEQAWHLGDLAAEYEDFIQEFAGLRPEPGDPVLFAQIRLVHDWRRFPSLDPQLPPDLLPPDWIGIRAANVFNDLHQAWHRSSQLHWDTLCAAEE
ncbi:PaaX family transcriptional regulator C-terminal domain-containing protein [Streptosporangium sp. 'caverna']|uniref:PaaX family transcriptional regulator n=1 Tax=Streptosporangium sp. 'caverna' TaxID=2202249 RepID=UPI000D7DA457|nr:PaaX family transcriptional regulator C-terminal domain-containing protein [Streptosporangium sp. 'caverna']AWS47106.1 PaaX family transcriptional regulator [Streptosporangium sp. 'caverna']